MTEADQAAYVTEAIKEAVCGDSAGVDNFQLIDDGGALHTGFYYAIKKAGERVTSFFGQRLKYKSSLKPVIDQIAAYDNGDGALCDS